MWLADGSYGDIERISINYDKWVKDRQYRNLLAKRIGWDNENELGRNVVSGHGSGSSFDGTSYNGKAEEMNTLDRWKQIRWEWEDIYLLDRLKPFIEKEWDYFPQKKEFKITTNKPVEVKNDLKW